VPLDEKADLQGFNGTVEGRSHKLAVRWISDEALDVISRSCVGINEQKKLVNV
jgi:hypothetical protein